MNSKTKFFFFTFALGYLAYQFFSLLYNPLPWFDEVFFASVSKSFSVSGKLMPAVSLEVWENKECLTYGPVYFFFESLSFKLFGFGILQYRWITLVSGLLTILVTANLLRLYVRSSLPILILIIAFSLDPFINLSMHEGRMDLMAALFGLISIYYLLTAIKKGNRARFIFAGIFAALSLLATPRIVVVVFPASLIFLLTLEGTDLKESLIKIFLYSIPVIVLYGLWILYAFGGIIPMLDYYKFVGKMSGDFLGGRLYIPKHEYLIILLTIVSIIYGGLKKGKEYFNPLVNISFLSLAAFYIIVIDWGPHSALILPFYYFLVFYGFGDIKFSYKDFSLAILLILTSFNAAYFSLKANQIFTQISIRDYKPADKFIRDNIPVGSKVIGDPQFYYSVIKGNSEYRLFDQFIEANQREKILSEEFDYDYMIVTERSKLKDPYLWKLFLKKSPHKKIAEFKSPVIEESYFEKLGIISSTENVGYNAELYVRVRENNKVEMALK